MGIPAVPRERFQRGVHGGMGDRRMRPFDSSIECGWARMRFIPQKSPEDDQPLRRHLHPGRSALLDKFLNSQRPIHRGHASLVCVLPGQ